jgi:hypothetical protein
MMSVVSFSDENCQVLPRQTAGSYLLPWPDFREPAVELTERRSK